MRESLEISNTGANICVIPHAASCLLTISGLNANAHRHQPLRHIALNAASERVHDVWHDACYNGALDRFRIDMIFGQKLCDQHTIFVRSPLCLCHQAKRRDQTFPVIYAKCNICISYVYY